MTELEQLRKVAEQALKVRQAQKLYFKHRWPNDLIDAQKEERVLDKLLAALPDLPNKTPSMFPEEPRP